MTYKLQMTPFIIDVLGTNSATKDAMQNTCNSFVENNQLGTEYCTYEHITGCTDICH